MKPFLKWAGGKYKIIDRIQAALPKGKQLIEPFVGSGAVFLNVDFEEYLLSDANEDLITLYKIIQEHGQNFSLYASELFNLHNNVESVFYELRSEFNDCTDPIRKSAIFIYLNRHCFNGLCRYNAKGHFNVPFGRYTSPSFPTNEILNFYKKSKYATFEVADFSTTMQKANIGSVVYCDPPYAPLTTTANFSNYTKDGFSLHDQKILADLAQELAERGVPVVISNHDTDFTQSLYANAKITSFDVQRYISSSANNRNKASELIASYRYNIMTHLQADRVDCNESC
jgi:DNA adenine methylase